MGNVDRMLSGDGARTRHSVAARRGRRGLARVAAGRGRAGAAADIPLLVGTTLEEWKLFGLMMDPTAITREKVVARAAAVAGDGEGLVDVYSER